MASNNLFPAQGKAVYITKNNIDKNLEFSKILANSETKPILVVKPRKIEIFSPSVEILRKAVSFEKIVKK